MAGTIVADTIQDGAGNSTAMDNAIYGSAKAWVNFNGSATSGSATIRASYNVSSVTISGTGTYTINFTNALTDTNYGVLCNGGQTNNLVVPTQNGGTVSTTQISIGSTVATTNAAYATPYVNVIIIR